MMAQPTRLNLTGRSGSLEAFLRKEIGIEEDAALAYLSDGRKLRTDNLLNLAEVHDQVLSTARRSRI